MGDFNFTTGTQTAEHIGTYMVKAQNTIDFSKHNCTSSGGVCEILSIPAGAYVERVIILMTTAEGDTMTFDVGDGDDPNGYDDAVNGNTTGATTSLAGTDNYAEGRYYSAADTIDISLDNDADAMILKVVAYYCIIE